MKAKRGKSTTAKRSRCHPSQQMAAEQKTEDKVSKKVVSDKKKLDSLYSSKNTCQAFLNPDGTKFKVMKSLTIPRAIIYFAGICLEKEDPMQFLNNCDPGSNTINGYSKLLGEAKLVLTRQKSSPPLEHQNCFV